jgi:hypothetical protein
MELAYLFWIDGESARAERESGLLLQFFGVVGNILQILRILYKAK